MSKYDIVLKETEKKTSKEIVSTYNLTDKEIDMIHYLYGKQYFKDDIVEYFYVVWDVTKKEVKEIISLLKKKGLIYTVHEEAGWYGTDIKV